jgi:hypothetical protein
MEVDNTTITSTHREILNRTSKVRRNRKFDDFVTMKKATSANTSTVSSPLVTRKSIVVKRRLVKPKDDYYKSNATPKMYKNSTELISLMNRYNIQRELIGEKTKIDIMKINKFFNLAMSPNIWKCMKSIIKRAIDEIVTEREAIIAANKVKCKSFTNIDIFDGTGTEYDLPRLSSTQGVYDLIYGYQTINGIVTEYRALNGSYISRTLTPLGYQTYTNDGAYVYQWEPLNLEF